MKHKQLSVYFKSIDESVDNLRLNGLTIEESCNILGMNTHVYYYHKRKQKLNNKDIKQDLVKNEYFNKNIKQDISKKENIKKIKQKGGDQNVIDNDYVLKKKVKQFDSDQIMNTNNNGVTLSQENLIKMNELNKMYKNKLL